MGATSLHSGNTPQKQLSRLRRHTTLHAIRLRRINQLPPFMQDNIEFRLRIANQSIHLDIIPVIAEWILELRADFLNAIQSENDETDDGDGPPAHVVDHGEGEDAAEEGKDLFGVDSVLLAAVKMGEEG